MHGLDERAWRYAQGYPVRADVGAAYAKLHDGWLPGTPQLALALYVRFAELARQAYADRGIPESVWQATMSDLGVWALQLRPGVWGVTEIGWLANHLTLRVFRLGRLQFEPKDGHVDVHIPEGEALRPQDCDASFDSAVRMFGITRFECDSWLLSPDLAEVLPPSSNIRSFAERFTVVEVDERDAQAYERITEGGSLYERTRALFAEGRNIRTARGFLDVGE